MKKLLSIVLAVAMGCALAACGGSKPAETTAAPAATTAAAAAETTAAPAAPAAPAAAGGDFIMGTGSSGGTYFALGGAMANAINNKLAADGITITAQSTGASVENINLMQAGEMDLGIAMNNVAANGYEGTGAFSAPTTNVKAIGVVYNEVYQIVANAETVKGAKNVEDLKGLKGDAATKMKDGHIDAACNVLAVPASSIIEMTTSMKLAYINIDDDILAAIQADAPYFTRKVIPAGTYPDQTEDCNTITCKAVLYCRADMDEETVYKITKAFYESGDEIAAAHATGKEVQLEGCLDGVTTPIHPGAEVLQGDGHRSAGQRLSLITSGKGQGSACSFSLYLFLSTKEGKT